MFWWLVVPRPMCGSHIDVALASSREGSRYRYDLVSAATLPVSISSSGMYVTMANSHQRQTARNDDQGTGPYGHACLDQPRTIGRFVVHCDVTHDRATPAPPGHQHECKATETRRERDAERDAHDALRSPLQRDRPCM